MREQFYENCIIEDRKSRSLIDFSKEQWFKDFMELTEILKEEKIESAVYFEMYSRIKELIEDDDFNSNFSFSKPILDFFISDEKGFIMDIFLDNYKPYEFGNCEDYNKKRFPTVNLPCILLDVNK